MIDWLDLREPIPPLEELMKNGGHGLINEIFKRMPYEEYLESAHWKEKRKYFWRKFGGRCCWCGEQGHEVHHLTYDNRGNEQDEDCILLCKPHHKVFHKNWELKVRQEGKWQFGREPR